MTLDQLKAGVLLTPDSLTDSRSLTLSTDGFVQLFLFVFAWFWRRLASWPWLPSSTTRTRALPRAAPHEEWDINNETNCEQ